MGSGKSVLIVDDEAATRAVLRHALEVQGYRVETAENGQQALSVISRRKPDVVLLDISMPVMDGWTTMRELRSREATRSLPIIVITALVHPEDEQEALDGGADAFMTKPFLGPELELRLAEVLSRR